jgi:hypothetical protein
MGVSVEHAEKVWDDAKRAVKNDKRSGSWYWGKVVNTFKRMIGIKEHMRFAEFHKLLEHEQDKSDFVLYEAEINTIPKLLKALPKAIMIGKGGYYLEVSKSTNMKIFFKVRKLLSDEDVNVTLVVSLRSFLMVGKKFLVQAGGEAVESLSWAQRSRYVDPEAGILDAKYLRDFMREVLAIAGMLNEGHQQINISEIDGKQNG